MYIGSGFNGNAIVALRGESDDDLNARHLDRVRWRTAAPYPITDAVTLSGDLAIVGGGNSDYVYAAPRPAGVVMALDRKSGELLAYCPPGRGARLNRRAGQSTHVSCSGWARALPGRARRT